MADPELKKKKGLFQRTLDRALGLNKPVSDIVPFVPNTPVTTAIEGIAAADDRALEQSVYGGKFGKRTFPTATAVGYATPMYHDAGDILARNRRTRLQMAEPFFRDPETGLVDRSRGSLWTEVATALPNQPNPPESFPGVVHKERTSGGPLDEEVGEYTMQRASDKAAKQRHFELMKRRDKKLGLPKDRGFVEKLIHNFTN